VTRSQINEYQNLPSITNPNADSYLNSNNRYDVKNSYPSQEALNYRKDDQIQRIDGILSQVLGRLVNIESMKRSDDMIHLEIESLKTQLSEIKRSNRLGDEFRLELLYSYSFVRCDYK
jgi:hypothetical protein